MTKPEENLCIELRKRFLRVGAVGLHRKPGSQEQRIKGYIQNKTAEKKNKEHHPTNTMKVTTLEGLAVLSSFGLLQREIQNNQNDLHYTVFCRHTIRRHLNF